MPILEDFQDRLSQHFHELRDRLSGDVSNRPLFVLEHGLEIDELEVLKSEVRRNVARRHIRTQPWLPLVVYATEVGYGYSGDEYWQTFEEETPGWEYEDGYLLRQRFIKFVEQFGGATPTGPWAKQFSLICWPITHAVLPTDLQRQVARLLYENRYELTARLLDHPDELGTKLAARAWNSSSRFQNFAQNSDLLGQVAVALLTGEDEESAYLLSSTLHRIVRDLNTEREARNWLRGAKRRAISVRTRGFLPAAATPSTASRDADRRRFPAPTDPVITIRRMSEGWVGFMQLPDLSPLAERFPALYDELSRLRCRVSGVDGPPLARGRILYSGQLVRLDSWPEPGHPLFEIEDGSVQGRSLLLDQSVLTSAPWLFRLRDESTGTEVRSRLVRPGGRYVLLSREPIDEEVADWIAPESCLTKGVYAYLLKIPIPLDANATTCLQALKLGGVSDVEIRPVGLVPAAWDGEGSAEWIVEEEPIVGIRSTKESSRLLVAVDGDPNVIEWPSDEIEIFLGLPHLEPGVHELQVALLGEGVEPLAQGRVSILLRQPQRQTGTGSSRDGLSVMAYPPGPGLAELWEGRSSLEVLGPAGANVSVHCALTARSSNEFLVERTFSAKLPLSPAAWLKNFTSKFRNIEQVQKSYDEAESCHLTFSHPELGERSVACDREFEPIRWSIGKDRDGPYAKLIDNTEGGSLVIQLSTFESPGDPITLENQPGLTFRNAQGGLVRAESNDRAASAILPPDVHDLADLHRTANPSRPRLTSRTAAGVKGLVDLASLWAEARLPSNPLATQQQQKVLRAIVAEIAWSFGGSYWATIERKASRTDALTRLELIEAIGRHESQRAMGSAVFDIATRLTDSPAETRASDFAAALRNMGQPSLRNLTAGQGELILRLLSDPRALTGMPSDDLQSVIELLLQAPIALRAARLLILAVHITETEDSGSCYRGWAWS